MTTGSSNYRGLHCVLWPSVNAVLGGMSNKHRKEDLREIRLKQREEQKEGQAFAMKMTEANQAVERKYDASKAVRWLRILSKLTFFPSSRSYLLPRS